MQVYTVNPGKSLNLSRACGCKHYAAGDTLTLDILFAKKWVDQGLIV